MNRILWLVFHFVACLISGAVGVASATQYEIVVINNSGNNFTFLVYSHDPYVNGQVTDSITQSPGSPYGAFNDGIFGNECELYTKEIHGITVRYNRIPKLGRGYFSGISSNHNA